MHLLRTAHDAVRGALMGPDPGLTRLRSATRTVVSLVVALVVLTVLTTVTGQTTSVAMVGTLIAMVSGMSSPDADPARQRVTMVLVPLVSAAVVTLAAFLQPHLLALSAAFVGVVYLATWAHRFGRRGTTLGTIAFMTFFFASILQAKVAEVPWLVASVVIGTACSVAVQAWVLRDRPDGVLRRTLGSLWERVRAVVGETASALGAGALQPRRRRRLGRRVTDLQDTTSTVTAQLHQHAGTPAPGGGDALALALFDVELATERLAAAGGAAAAAGAVAAPARADLVAVLRQLQAALPGPLPSGWRGRLPGPAPEGAGPGPVGAGERPTGAAEHLSFAIARVVAATGRAQAVAGQGDSADGAAPLPGPVEPAAATTGAPASPPARSTPAEPAPAEPAPAPPALPREPAQRMAWAARLRPTTRQAIQVAVAAALAIACGQRLSSVHWYWAVLTAFLVYAGTTSRGQTLSRGWQRVLGTFLGVPAGLVAATLAGGRPVWSLLGVFVCVFFMMYLRQVSYALMSLFVTMMLSLLYGLKGALTFDVLLVRLGETVIGAGIGVGVAVLVLPVSTLGTVRGGVRDALAALADVLSAVTGHLAHDPQAAGLTSAARGLDQSLQKLRTSALPLTGGVLQVSENGSVEHVLEVLTACDSHARALVRAFGPGGGAPVDPAVLAQLRTAADRVGHNATVLAGAVVEDGRGTAGRHHGGGPQHGSGPHPEHAATPQVVASAVPLLDQVDQVDPPGDVGRTGQGGGVGRPRAARSPRDAVVHLSRIDQAVTGLAHDLGARVVVAPSPSAA